ncbi:innate immunity activator b isoform X2 [Lampris incognitus]|uniref:innate immunity activator b isoform X2 n=1 Tax=Lampris incognitus TaxID=2546036 RepID=UPI0024B5D5D1|nr:innate immunity activator b isoform X2 [Lampris incognitus]
MEGTGEISDTDSGIILHSGSDSPTTHTKDVPSHTRAMRSKHQSLQDRLELCLLELEKLCIREAELTGQLSADYPLLPGEKPPQVRRRIGAAFRLDATSIPGGAEESELDVVDAEVGLQLKIYEAARKLCREDHLNKAIKRSRLQQCKQEERKLKQLQETAFQLRLQHRQSLPRPTHDVTKQDQGTSDDSSLSDSAVLDEEATSQSSQPSLGLPHPGVTNSSQPLPESSPAPTESFALSPSMALQPLTPSQSNHAHLDLRLSLNSDVNYEAPPIQHSPWTESSLDQPYQRTKKSRSSSIKSSSPVTPQVLPPLEACLGPSSLQHQFSHLKLCHTQSASAPSTPELRLHRQLSLRLSSAESSCATEKIQGCTRRPRRRLTDYTVALPESHAPRLNYGNHTNSEDSNSEHSSTSYASSPCQEMLCDLPRQSPFQYPSPAGSSRHLTSSSPVFYGNTRHLSSPSFNRRHYKEEVGYIHDANRARSYHVQQSPCPSERHDYSYTEASVQLQRSQRHRPRDVRLSHSPSLLEHPQYHSGGLPRHVVNEELKSWHQRSKFKVPRPRSLDREGAIRRKNNQDRETPLCQSRKYQERMGESYSGQKQSIGYIQRRGAD